MPNIENLFNVGTKYTVLVNATSELMFQFREMAGDENPIHFDTKFAVAHGFKGPIVYGNLLGAIVSRLIGMELPSRDVVILRQLLEFRKPVYIGEEISLVAEVTAIHTAVQSVQFELVFNSTSTHSFCTGQCLIKCL